MKMQNHIQSMDDTGYVTQDCQEDIDQQVGSTTTLQEDTKRWEEDGNDDLADITNQKMLAFIHRCLLDVVAHAVADLSEG